MKKKKENDLLKTIVASGIAGVIVICLMGFLMLQVIKDDQSNEDKGKKAETTDVVPVEQEVKGPKLKMTAVVDGVSVAENKVAVIHSETDERIEISIPKTLEIKDRYGTQMTIKELNSGDVVYTKYAKEGNVALEFRLSSEAWEYTTKGVTVNKEAKTLSRGNETYTYSDTLISLSAGQVFDIGTITELDQVKINGYKDKLLSLELVSSHGFVEFIDYATHVGATADIDLDRNVVLEEDMKKIMVEEGKHRIVIKKDGYEPFIKEVLVLPGASVKISLEEFQPKRGEVEFSIEPKEAQIYIDEKLQSDLSQPVLLDYGTYNLRIILDDLVVAEEELVVDKTYISYNKSIAPPDKRRSIKIMTDPIGAELFIDNKFMGYTPITIMLDPGDYNAMILKQGYNMAEYPIHVTEGKDEQTFTFPPLRQKSENGNNGDNNTGVTDPAPPSGTNETEDPQPPTDEKEDEGGIKTPGDDVYKQEG